jgi:hypothetical protein
LFVGFFVASSGANRWPAWLTRGQSVATQQLARPGSHPSCGCADYVMVVVVVVVVVVRA